MMNLNKTSPGWQGHARWGALLWSSPPGGCWRSTHLSSPWTGRCGDTPDRGTLTCPWPGSRRVFSWGPPLPAWRTRSLPPSPGASPSAECSSLCGWSDDLSGQTNQKNQACIFQLILLTRGEFYSDISLFTIASNVNMFCCWNCHMFFYIETCYVSVLFSFWIYMDSV